MKEARSSMKLRIDVGTNLVYDQTSQEQPQRFPPSFGEEANRNHQEKASKKKKDKSMVSVQSNSDSAGSGKWTEEEHQLFLLAYSRYGKAWAAIKLCVPTRSGSQIRSHAQKYERQLRKKEIAKIRDAGELPRKKFLITKDFKDASIGKVLTQEKAQEVLQYIQANHPRVDQEPNKTKTAQGMDDLDLPSLGFIDPTTAAELKAWNMSQIPTIQEEKLQMIDLDNLTPQITHKDIFILEDESHFKMISKADACKKDWKNECEGPIPLPKPRLHI